MTEMTQRPPHEAPSPSDGGRISADDEESDRQLVFEDPAFLSADQYPRALSLSAGMLYRRVIRATAPVPPEYVCVPLPACGPRSDTLAVAISKWNMAWEAAQFRGLIAERFLPQDLSEIAGREDVNVTFLPRTATRYHEYSLLFHLLPRALAERYGLPLLRAGQWPYLADAGDVDRFLPADFEVRLSRAWASLVWRHLMSGSPQGAFSGSDPIRLLAHNLDFWLPPVTAVVEDVLRSFPVVDDAVGEYPPPLADGGILPGALAVSPRKGGDLWRGEAEAAEVVQWTIDEADAEGRLRGILDAVRSNRVEDDFSERWSYAREDFERKLYHKRSKVKVRFVELTDTIPVQGPETEVEDGLVFADFLALLDERERQIVILLNSGMTKVGDVAATLGYKNHSPVSKRLARIRAKAAEHFGLS